MPLDENAERGHSWTFSWIYEASDIANIAVEWLEIQTTRPAWAYNALETSQTERQVQLSLQLRFGNR